MKSFEWLLQQLSTHKAKVPILDTVFFKDGRAEYRFVNNSQNIVEKQDMGILTVKDYLNILQIQHDFNSKSSYNFTCYIHNKESRKLSDGKNLKDYKSVYFVQRAEANDEVFVYKHSRFKTSIKSSTKEKIEDKSFCEEASEIAKSIMACIEPARMLSSEIHFMINSNKKLAIASIEYMQISNNSFTKISSFNFDSSPRKMTIRREASFTKSKHLKIKSESKDFNNNFIEMISKTNIKGRFNPYGYDFALESEIKRIQSMLQQEQRKIDKIKQFPKLKSETVKKIIDNSAKIVKKKKAVRAVNKRKPKNQLHSRKATDLLSRKLIRLEKPILSYRRNSKSRLN